MIKIGEGKEETLGTIQKGIEEAAGKVPRDKMVKRTPVSVGIREEAAARCTQVINRRVLKKQARKARADHLVICSMMPGRRRKRKQRHCEGVYADPDETREVLEKRIEYFQKERRSAVHGRRKRSRDYNRFGACRPEQRCLKTRSTDWFSCCNRDDQAVALEKININTRCLISSWKIVKLVFFRKPRCGSKEVDQELQGHRFDISDVEVDCIMY